MKVDAGPFFSFLLFPSLSLSSSILDRQTRARLDELWRTFFGDGSPFPFFFFPPLPSTSGPSGTGQGAHAKGGHLFSPFFFSCATTFFVRQNAALLKRPPFFLFSSFFPPPHAAACPLVDGRLVSPTKSGVFFFLSVGGVAPFELRLLKVMNRTNRPPFFSLFFFSSLRRWRLLAARMDNPWGRAFVPTATHGVLFFPGLKRERFFFLLVWFVVFFFFVRRYRRTHFFSSAGRFPLPPLSSLLPFFVLRRRGRANSGKRWENEEHRACAFSLPPFFSRISPLSYTSGTGGSLQWPGRKIRFAVGARRQFFLLLLFPSPSRSGKEGDKPWARSLHPVPFSFFPEFLSLPWFAFFRSTNCSRPDFVFGLPLFLPPFFSPNFFFFFFSPIFREFAMKRDVKGGIRPDPFFFP